MAENRAGLEEGKSWKMLAEGGEKSKLEISRMFYLVDSAQWWKGAHVSRRIGKLSNKGPPPLFPSSGLGRESFPEVADGGY